MAVVLPGEGFSSRLRAKDRSEFTPAHAPPKPRFDRLQLNQPVGTGLGGPSEKVTLSRPEEASGADKQLRDYLSLIEQLRNPETQLERFITEARNIFSQIEELAELTPESISSLQFDASVLGSVEFAAAVSVDANSISGAASVLVRNEYSISGELRLANGTVIQFTSEASVQISAAVAFRVSAEQPPQQMSDPLALDIDKDGEISLSDIGSGINFDINADGEQELTAFVQGSDGFLAYDRNRNGTIDDGGELFGDQHGQKNGFLELGLFDDDKNQVIDERDQIYSALSVLRRGVAGELTQTSLADLGITAIGLSYQEVLQQAGGGNLITQLGSYQGLGGSSMSADVLLRYQPL